MSKTSLCALCAVLLTKIRAEINKATCDHRDHFYTMPRLEFTETGAPQVVSESYCKGCGISLFNPLKKTNAEILAMLQQGELMRNANERR